jgi:maltooligosyltrehalose trehalohydrolase
MSFAHALPFGAELSPGGAVFRIWAPTSEPLLEIDGRPPIPMQARPDGVREAVADCAAGARYRYRLADGTAIPDPASRLQAGDVHDQSVVVDPRAYAWRNQDWTGRPWHEAVVYELHAGAFGGFKGVEAQLPRLAALGFTAIELMPIADFPGRRNWGYDGVLPYAPDAAYGTPDELKSLIDAAHDLGLMIFLDVVYNHFGPDGNYLHAYAETFFRSDITTPWGASIDFREPHVRAYFIQNALYWLMEYRFDGLRFDAVHAISERDFLTDMAAAVRAGVEPGRRVHLILENEDNDAGLLEESFDAQWADDFHHCVHVMLTGESEGYYADFQDAATMLLRCLTEGFAFQGETAHTGKPRGEPSAHLPPTAFVICLQNHDQIGNRALGERLTRLAHPDALRAAAALLLLSPFIPMVFMGEEWGSSRPFLFFTDHNPDLGKLVREGRRKEFAHFAAFADPERREAIPDPNDSGIYEASVPDPAEAAEPAHAAVLELHRELLALRRRYVAPGIPGARSEGGEVLGPKAVVARWRLGDGRLLTIAANLGEAPAPVGDLAGELLYATGDRMALIVPEGALPGRTTAVYLGERPA